jgi:hypothetical protein
MIVKTEYWYGLIGLGVLYLLWKRHPATKAAETAAPVMQLPSGQSFNPLDPLSLAVATAQATQQAVNSGSDAADVFGPTMQDGNLFTGPAQTAIAPPGMPTLQNWMPTLKVGMLNGNSGPIYSPPPPRNIDS